MRNHWRANQEGDKDSTENKRLKIISKMKKKRASKLYLTVGCNFVSMKKTPGN